MFGESESESPRVPSPWDSLISTPPSPSLSSRSQASPSPLSIELPRLVPEADEGNIEYKLQLLSPSPARFARLVTQLKWRLLEGGGQAYYELGVADSGALVGLPRAEMEQSLETLEMMAGEIGASVIVVKEIEVPAVMAGIAASQTDKWNGKRKKRAEVLASSEGSESSTTATWTTTETETEPSTDFDEDLEDMSTTVVLNKDSGTIPSIIPRSIGDRTPWSRSSVSLFSMDPDTDPAENADTELDEEPTHPYLSIDLEILSVFKPRPMRARMQMHTAIGPAKTKRLKKIKHLIHPHANDISNNRLDHTYEAQPGKYHPKSNKPQQTHDRRRADKRKASPAFTTDINTSKPISIPNETSVLVTGLESLHVSPDDLTRGINTANTSASSECLAPIIEVAPVPDGRTEGREDDDDDDVFASPTAASPFTTFSVDGASSAGRSASSVQGVDGEGLSKPALEAPGQSRLIVEALVVRKMSLDEAFLDFGGFAMI